MPSEFVPYRKVPFGGSADANAPSRGGKKGKGRGGKANAGASSATQQELSSQSSADPFRAILSSSQSAGATSAAHPETVEENAASRQMAESDSAKSKKQSKYVPLFHEHGHELHVTLPGRHPCQCMCTKHDLITNCLNCGRIVCQQEGSGPCFTCGQLVCTPEERSILARGGLEATKLKRQLEGSSALTMEFDKMLHTANAGEGHLKAQEHRDKLLEYDRTSAQRTKVIDDQADYYNENVFMTREQRELVRRKEEERRKERFRSVRDRTRIVNLDFAGRELREAGSHQLDDMYSAPDADVLALATGYSSKTSSRLHDIEENRDRSKSLSLEEEMALLPDFPESSHSLKAPRVQDRELQEMTDTGATLSVMQPWASFIVMGLKPHEGRDWYTAHRGKLWIRSGAKMLLPDEVVQEENLVKALVGDEFIVFPEQYLTSFLLGSVDLVDCITQEEYQRRFPGGLLRDPYILLLCNPVELERKFPLDGKNKIYKMDPKLHQLAKMQPYKRPERVWRPPEVSADEGNV